MIWTLISIPIIAYLWFVGGGKEAWARDILIPIIVGIIVFLRHPIYDALTWENLLLSIAMIASCNIIRLGYGDYDPDHDDVPSLLASITKDKNGWWVRGLWGMIVGVISLIPIIVASYMKKEPIMIIKCFLFAIGFSILSFIVVRLRSNRLITDIVIGTAFMTIMASL